MARVEWHGVTLNKRSAKMMDEVQRGVGFRIRPTQGSYSGSVGASAGTHNGGGAIDISVRGLTTRQINRLVKRMRRVGWAAWYRPTLPGVWSSHVHAIALGTRDLPPLARAQVLDYKKGRNGLKGHAVDRHIKMMRGHGGDVPYQNWEQYLKAKRANR